MHVTITRRRAFRRILEAGPVAFRVNLRVLALAAFAAVCVLVLVGLGLAVGSYTLPFREVIRALSGRAAGDAVFIVTQVRLPRVLAALSVGLALATAGAIFQGIVRNPLVSPDIVGINAGASVAAVFWIVSGLPLAPLPAIAFGGAVLAGAAVYALSWRGRLAPSRLVLVGIGMNAILNAGVTLLIVRGNSDDVNRAYQWMAGSLYARNWSDVWLLTFSLPVLVAASILLMRPLRMLQLGDATARNVGVPLEPVRLALLGVGCGFSALAVSVAGPIGFVALMVPHLARMLAGPITSGVFLVSGLLGSALLLGADLLAQHVLPVALPVGVVTSSLGAPYFLLLLYRSNVRM